MEITSSHPICPTAANPAPSLGVPGPSYRPGGHPSLLFRVAIPHLSALAVPVCVCGGALSSLSPADTGLLRLVAVTSLRRLEGP